MKKSLYLVCSMFLLANACKSKTSRLKSKSCLYELKKELPKNVKNKLYWESDDFAVSLGINFDEKRGTFALASENGERSNLSVHVLSKNRNGERVLLPINPKVEYTAVFGGYGLRLTDDNIPFVMTVSFPTPNQAILHNFKIAQFERIPTKSLVNKRTISSRLKGNKYFGAKNPSDWENFIKRKIDLGCDKKTSRLCASLALETLDEGGTTFSWKMFDFLSEDTISDLNKVGFETDCIRSGGRKICDISLLASSKSELKLSQMLKLAGLGLSPETSRILEDIGIQYSDWLDWIAGTLPPSQENRMTFRISFPETTEFADQTISVKLLKTDFRGINRLNVFDIKLDGSKTWLNVNPETYGADTINYFANMAKLDLKIDRYAAYINGLNQRVERTMLSNKTKFDINLNSKTYPTRDTDVKVSWQANNEYKLQDVFDSFFDIGADLDSKNVNAGIKIKVPKSSESTNIFFRLRDLPSSDANIKHRRYIALCGVELYADAIEGVFENYEELLKTAKVVTRTRNEAKAIKKGLNFLVPVYVQKQNIDGSITYSAKLFDPKINGKICG